MYVFNPLYAGIQNDRLENPICYNLEKLILDGFFRKMVVLEVNCLDLRPGSSYVDPDLHVGSSLFAISLKC